MAATAKPTSTIQHFVYCKLAAPSVSNPSSSTNLTAVVHSSGTLVTVQSNNLTSSNRLVNTISAGPVSKTGNPSEYTPYGEATSKTIAGPASLGEFPVRFVVDEDDTLHASLLAASPGAKIELATIKATGLGAAGYKLVAYYMRGTILSQEITFDTPGECGFSIALDREPIRLA